MGSIKENKIILEPVYDIILKGKGLLKRDGKKILDYLLEERKREVEREEKRLLQLRHHCFLCK